MNETEAENMCSVLLLIVFCLTGTWSTDRLALTDNGKIV